MSNGAFPFRAAKPKGAPSNKPSMSFELPAAPPVEKPAPPEVPFEAGLAEAVEEERAEQSAAFEEDMAKKAKRGRPKKTGAIRPVAPSSPKAARFTFAEVVEVLGEDVPFVKVVAKITPIIEILKPDDRRRVVDILVRLYG